MSIVGIFKGDTWSLDYSSSACLCNFKVCLRYIGRYFGTRGDSGRRPVHNYFTRLGAFHITQKKPPK